MTTYCSFGQAAYIKQRAGVVRNKMFKKKEQDLFKNIQTYKELLVVCNTESLNTIMNAYLTLTFYLGQHAKSHHISQRLMFCTF